MTVLKNKATQHLRLFAALCNSETVKGRKCEEWNGSIGEMDYAYKKMKTGTFSCRNIK